MYLLFPRPLNNNQKHHLHLLVSDAAAPYKTRKKTHKKSNFSAKTACNSEGVSGDVNQLRADEGRPCLF